jgi:hypothetical protein
MIEPYRPHQESSHATDGLFDLQHRARVGWLRSVWIGDRGAAMQCRTCGGEMIQKGRLRLFVVGALMVASIGLAPFVPFLWALGILLFLAGAYLLVRATLGNGFWCRACKRISVW